MSVEDILKIHSAAMDIPMEEGSYLLHYVPYLDAVSLLIQ